MKNVSNPYGYYLTEDFETIELRGNFEENAIFLPTKNPDEQLNYKVFVSPKKSINFGIQIVGGTNPNVIYIPQHIYKELQIGYTENNPYYTIKDITIVKLDFTDTGNSLIKYLKQKFENTTSPTNPSKIASAGVTSIVSYAGFNQSGQPVDEDILKQILFLFDEENDVIFVDKDVVLVTEDVVKARGYTSNRIKGDFKYTSNYFDSSGKFNSPLLNSQANITLEDNTVSSVSSLNDFVKDFAGKSLTEINSIYKSNISIETAALQAPKILGLAVEGLSKVTPLVKAGLDKLSQLKAQRAQKKLAEAKAVGANALGSAKNIGQGLMDSTGAELDSSKEQGQAALDAEKNVFKKPLTPKISAKVPDSIKVKPVENKYKGYVFTKTQAEADEQSMRERAARLAGVDDDYDEDQFENRTYEDPIANAKYQNTLANLKKKAASDKAEESLMNIKTDSKSTSIKTISTVGNVSQAEGQQMLKNAGKSTPSSIKQINADFLKF